MYTVHTLHALKRKHKHTRNICTVHTLGETEMESSKIETKFLEYAIESDPMSKNRTVLFGKKIPTDTSREEERERRGGGESERPNDRPNK